MKKYPALFAPGKIGKLESKNRIIMAPMMTGFASMEGYVSDKLLEYYEARARGGAGAIIVEAACVDSPAGKEGNGQIDISDTSYIGGITRLSRTIKRYGTLAFIQLLHAGRQTSSKVTGVQPVAPSAIPCGKVRETPRELEIEDIILIENKYVNAAVRASMAGFDGIELHAAHGYLLNQFLSGHSNLRQDMYGGSLKNRMRILVNIVSGIKRAVPDLAISVRLNIDDFIEDGLTPDESVIISQELEKNGADLIHCSCGTYESGLASIEPVSYAEGWRIYLADKVKKAVGIPVCGGGMLSSPEFANNVIENAQADFVFLGRSMLADPDWAHKAGLEREDDIRPCIRCNHCIGSSFKGVSISCTVNPAAGREKKYGTYSTRTPVNYRVAVIGSGPAGMQAALTLDRSGAMVTLLEKQDKAGGLMNLASIPPFKHRVRELRDYMVKQIQKSNIDVIYNHCFNLQEAEDNYFNAIILASGAAPYVPPISGLNQTLWYNIEEVLTDKVRIKNSKVVIIGGGENACETADFLLKHNNHISIIEQQDRLLSGMEKKNRRDLINRLQEGKVDIKCAYRVNNIHNNLVQVFNRSNISESIKTDYIIVACGYRPLNQLYSKLKTVNDNVHIIGDALRVRGFRSAILEGEMTARAIVAQSGDTVEVARGGKYGL